jgi:hypothetical protein
MHFRQYHNRFTLMTDHKPLEWLDVVSNVYGRRGKWINTLQIVHQARSWHINVDAMSHNLVDAIEANENSGDEVKDCKIL